MNPKVSIIVPIHNSKHYLKKCLDSLIAQSLHEIEIILVIDCPTDGSDKIAESFAEQDSRVKLIYNKQNLHTGHSRNKGMAEAKGKYIGFHDHDDYCEPEMYNLLYQKAEEGAFDVGRCNFSSVYTKETESITDPYKYPQMPTDQWSKEWIYENVGSNQMSCVIWNHIYRADFLKEHHILFLDSREVCSEDSIFFLEVYNQINRLGIVPNYSYYHVFHRSNTGKVYDYRSIEHRISFFNELSTFFESNGVAEEKKLSILSENVLRSLYSGSRQALCKLPITQALNAIFAIRKNKLMMNCIHYIFRKENKEIKASLKPTIIILGYILKFYTPKFSALKN